MKNNSSNNGSLGSILLGIAIGSAVGSAIALLYAPKSGRELRRDIREKSSEYYDAAANSLEDVYVNAVEKGESLLADVNEMLGSLKNNAGELLSSSTEGIENKLGKIKKSVESFLETYNNIGVENLVESITENHIPRKLKKKLKSVKDMDVKKEIAEKIKEKMD